MNLLTLLARPQLALAALSVALTASSASAYDNMVVFGDSLSDNGNLSLLAGPGTFAGLNYDSLRATDGTTTTPATSIVGLTVEQLDIGLGLAPLTPSLIGGNNYAWGMATTGMSPLDLLHGTTPGTGAQVATYLATHPSVSPNSLFVLWAGSNDLVDATSLADIQNAETTAIGNLHDQITELLDAGAKNIVWFNLPDLSLTPTGLSAPIPVQFQLHASSAQFRSDWQSTLQQLHAAHPDAQLTGVDVYSLLNQLVGNPATYGFTNVTDPAQGLSNVNPDEYVFWDSLHPTTRADQLLAGFALQQVQPVPEPSGSVYLGFAMLAVIGARSYIRRRGCRT